MSWGAARARAAAAPQVTLPESSRVAEIEAWLPKLPEGVGPRIADRALWDKQAKSPGIDKFLARADRINDEPVTDVPEELFLLFTRKGDRASWEKQEFRRRGNFTTLVLAECLRNDGRYLGKISDYILAICAERTWVYSAHDGKLANFSGKTIDIELGSSTLAWQLATADWWLGDKLPSDTRNLLHENLQRRIIDPMMLRYTGKAAPFWWQAAEMNWNTVCLAGVTGTAMAFVHDRHERALFAAAAELYSRNFLKGFGPDGYCSEGLGYWDYGFGRFVMLAETLMQATHGKLDLLAAPAAKLPAEFGSRIQIINGVAPAFADSPVYPKPDPNLMYYLNRRFQLGLSAFDHAASDPLTDLDQEALFRFPNSVSGEFPAKTAAAYKLRDWFSHAGILISRPPEHSDCHVGVALKGGNNAENHNHNDVGSYVFVLNDKSPLLDPGHERYTARTFSAHRYDSNLLNSFGHDVPKVAGQLQRTGAAAHAKVVKAEFTDMTDTLTLDITSAYAVPELMKLERTWVYSRRGEGSLTVTDHATFKSPQSFGTALITLGKWSQVDASDLRIEDGEQAVTVSITANGATSVEPTVIKEDAPVTPTRLGVDLVKKSAEATITLVITPAK
ncbi:MAG: hypothetical protein ACTHN5_10445 [Phycisphaerae bacterium]